MLFIKQKLDAAKWFIEAIEQRYNTLYMTINAIVAHQKAYFLSGDEKHLKPMILNLRKNTCAYCLVYMAS